MRPIFETPRLDDLTPSTGARKGFLGSVEAGFEAQRLFDNFQSREMVLSRAYADYLDEIEAATGERLASGGAFGGRVDMARLELGRGGDTGARALAALEQEFADLQQRRPELDLPPPSSVMERLRAEAIEVEDAEAQAGMVGGFVGRVGGALTDPITLATSPIGGSSKTILRAAGVEAAVNALMETANIPIANRWRAELGVDTMDAGEAAVSVGIAAATGGILGAAGKAGEIGVSNAVSRLSNRRLSQALRDLSGDNPERAALAAALQREAEIEAANPFGASDADLHEQRLQDAVTVLTEPGSDQAQAAASRLSEPVSPRQTRPDVDLTLDGYHFPDALHRRLYALGQADDADMGEAEALFRAFKGFATEEEGLSDLNSADDLVAYARGYAQDVIEDGDAFDVIDPDMVRDWQRQHGASYREPLGNDLPSGLTQIDPRTLEVDAARFQFKAGGDAAGVTDRLAGVTQWDPVRAGIAIVFEQEDGRRFIADGHQRRGLATRLLDANPDQDIRLTAFVYREADGWSDADIRAVAAAKNLAEGTGTAIDAAKILRADPDLLDGSLPSRGALIRDAQGLMRLGDPAFGAVINEVVPANYGAIVGRIIDDPDEQLAVLQQLARAEVRNAIEAEALVRGAQAAGFARREGSTGSLFGDVPTESLIADRARTLSRAIAILRKEKTVFSTLAREADRIESAGNQLARETNQQRARTDGEILEILQALAHRAGPVADALNARVRQSDGNTAAAARNFVGDLRDITAQGDLGRLLAGGSGRNADPAAPGGAAGDAARVDSSPASLEPGRFDGGADDPAMAGQADNLEPDAGFDPDEDFETALLFDPGEGPRRERVTAADVEAEIAADDAAVERLRGCVPK